MTGIFQFDDFGEDPSEQPDLEEQNFTCMKCFTSTTMVVDLSDTDMEYMCPECHGKMVKK